MSITLEEATVGRADKVTQEVIDTLRRGSVFMDKLTFDDAVSPGVGGSTMTYGYLQLQTPSTAAGRAINSEYAPNEAKKVKKTVDLKSSAAQLRLTVLFRRLPQTKSPFSLIRRQRLLKTISSTPALTAQRLISQRILTV